VTPPSDAPPPGASHPSDDADIRPEPKPLRKGPEGEVQVFGADEQGAASVDVDRWVTLARDVLVAEGVSGDAELSLLFVDEEAIAELNGRFMDAEGPTDVLAFPIDDPVVAGRWPDSGTAGPDREDPEPGDLPLLLGDVVVCPAVAMRNAPQHAGTITDELALLVVHGTLHILGHDHADSEEEQKMQSRERALLERHHWRGDAPVTFTAHRP
jgi:probable rRNA maturation factor